MRVKVFFIFAFLQTFFSGAVNDSTRYSFVCCRPDALAPAGIMTDHVHEKGKFALAYSFMFMHMKGNQQGAKNITDEAVFQSYMMSATAMNMQMHMLMPMYGITARLTVMAMLNYAVYDMSMRMMPAAAMNMPGMLMTDNSNMPEEMRSYGLSDTRLLALYNVLQDCNQRLVFNLGVSLPTGDVDVRGETMQSSYGIFPYGMQLGSGTYDLLNGCVYSCQATRFSFGAAATTNLRTGVNKKSYRVGNEYNFSPWISYQLKDWMSFSFRSEYYRLDKMKGYDREINLSSNNDAGANILNTGAQRININVGMNLYAPGNFLQGSRLLLEYGIPLYQKTNGIQSTLRSTLSARIQYDF